VFPVVYLLMQPSRCTLKIRCPVRTENQILQYWQFDAVQAKGAGSVARAAAQTGARLVHVSAIGADADSRAAYARSKAQGEALVLAEAPEATIFRPSIIFGPEDQFFNRFAAMARISPFLPLIGRGHARFQPVFVGDVAHAIAKAASGDTKPGTTYELGGPDVRTFKELIEFVLATARPAPAIGAGPVRAR